MPRDLCALRAEEPELYTILDVSLSLQLSYALLIPFYTDYVNSCTHVLHRKTHTYLPRSVSTVLIFGYVVLRYLKIYVLQ